MKNVIITFFNLLLFLSTMGHQTDHNSSSFNNGNILLEEFIKEMETNTSFRFYFRQEWIKDLQIAISDTNSYSLDILKEQLKKLKLNIYESENNIYLYPGEPIIIELPTYKRINQYKFNNDSLKNITDYEKKYLEGKKNSSIEVLLIGTNHIVSSGSRCVIDGKIIDELNSEPLIGATVFIEELKIGVATDVDGRFKLVLQPGRYKATFHYMSMSPQEYFLQINASGSVVIKMKRELTTLDEVKVTSDRYNNVKGIQMGFEKISAKTVKVIPVAFGERDVLKVAQLLPGVLNVGEGSSGFNVRGSSEDQNMFYINKIPVYNTSHLFGFFTSFNPDIINDFSFYKSNIPANYGGRLSSFFNITTRQGSKKKFFTQGGLSPITAHASVEIPVVKDMLSIVASFRSSYSDWILKKIQNADLMNSSALFYDGSFSISTNINDNNQLTAFLYLSRDKFSLSSLSDYDYSNKGYSLNWKHMFSPTLSSNFTLINSNYSFKNVDKTNLSTAFTQKYEINHCEIRSDFSILNRTNHNIEFGANSILYNLDKGNIQPYGYLSKRSPINLGKEIGVESALYFSDEFSVLNNLTLLTGLRYSMFNQLGPAELNLYYPENIRTGNTLKDIKEYKKGSIVKTYSGPEYRFALNYIFGNNNSMKASYNRLYQYIFMLSNTISVSPNDKWKLCDYHIKPPLSDQFSVGYYHNFKDGEIKISIELYHKWIKNQVEYKDGIDFTSSNPIETLLLQGKQRVNGIELMINKTSGKTTGWFSYCYSRSFIKVYDENIENQINYGLEYPANYDRPHSANLVLNYKVNRRLNLSTNFVYTTGRPITYPVSLYYNAGQLLFNFSNRNEFRIPDYIRWDLSINLEGNLNRRKPIHSFWSLNLYNALGRKNAYSVYFDINNGRVEGHKLSIFGVPIFTLSWNYKFGNYMNE
jgi:hypothetical protein